MKAGFGLGPSGLRAQALGRHAMLLLSGKTVSGSAVSQLSVLVSSLNSPSPPALWKRVWALEISFFARWHTALPGAVPEKDSRGRGFPFRIWGACSAGACSRAAPVLTSWCLNLLQLWVPASLAPAVGAPGSCRMGGLSVSGSCSAQWAQHAASSSFFLNPPGQAVCPMRRSPWHSRGRMSSAF